MVEPKVLPATEGGGHRTPGPIPVESVRQPAAGTLNPRHSGQRAKPVVQGPIRCHKCQLNCVDAEHYLNHKCEPRPLD